jgi:hypothetical protein
MEQHGAGVDNMTREQRKAVRAALKMSEEKILKLPPDKQAMIRQTQIQYKDWDPNASAAAARRAPQAAVLGAAPHRPAAKQEGWSTQSAPGGTLYATAGSEGTMQLPKGLSPNALVGANTISTSLAIPPAVQDGLRCAHCGQGYTDETETFCVYCGKPHKQIKERAGSAVVPKPKGWAFKDSEVPDKGLRKPKSKKHRPKEEPNAYKTVSESMEIFETNQSVRKMTLGTDALTSANPPSIIVDTRSDVAAAATVSTDDSEPPLAVTAGRYVLQDSLCDRRVYYEKELTYELSEFIYYSEEEGAWFIGEALGATRPIDPSQPLPDTKDAHAQKQIYGSVAMGSSRGAAREERGVIWARLLDTSPSPLTAGVTFKTDASGDKVWAPGGRWEQWSSDTRSWMPAACLTIRDESKYSYWKYSASLLEVRSPCHRSTTTQQLRLCSAHALLLVLMPVLLLLLLLLLPIHTATPTKLRLGASKIHKTKMGNYVFQGGLWESRPYYKKAEGPPHPQHGEDLFLYYNDEKGRWIVGAQLGGSTVILQVRDTALSPLEIIGTWQSLDGAAWISDVDVYIRNISEY